MGKNIKEVSKMKYLIVKCEVLDDQYECDANRIPLCITDDISEYEHEYGYEIYEVKNDGTFSLVKNYEDTRGNSGMAIYFWKNENEVEDKLPDIVYEKFPQVEREFFTEAKIEEIKKTYHLTESTKYIKDEVRCFGSYGTILNDGWFVIGYYNGSVYELGI